MTTKTDPAETDQPEAPPAEPGQADPGAAVAVPLTLAEVEAILAPHTVDMRTWLRALLVDEELPEEDPDEMALGMLAQIMFAKSSEEVLSIFDLDRAKELCGGEPGGRSPVLEIQGARALHSTYEEGAPCYVIVAAINCATGERIQFTTGARAVQMAILKHIHEGWMPFRACLEIRREATRRGFHPLNLVAGI
jgi:hypothetical protein